MAICTFCKEKPSRMSILIEDKPLLWYRHSQKANEDKKSNDTFIPLKRRRIELCDDCKNKIREELDKWS